MPPSTAAGAGDTRAKERLPLFFALMLVAIPLLLVAFAVPIYAALQHGNLFKVQGWSAEPRGNAWVVTSVDPAGPATQLRAGDVLLAIDGDTRAAHIGDRWFLRDAPPNTAYELTVHRGSRVLDVPLALTTELVPGTIVTRIIPLLVLALAFFGAGVILWLARPNEAMARRAVGTTMLGATFFLFLATNEGAGMLQGPVLALAIVFSSVSPLHFMFGYLFFSSFTVTVKPSPRWRALGAAVVGAGIALWVALTLHNVLRLIGGDTAIAIAASAPRAARVYDAVVPSAQMLYVALVLVATLAIVQHNYRALPEGNERRRLKWIATGALVGLVPMILAAFTLFFARAAGMDETRGAVAAVRTAGNVGGIALPLTMGYAVLKQRVLGPRIALRVGLQYLMARNVLRVLLAFPLAGLLITLAVNRDRTVSELFSGAAGVNLALLAAAAASIRYRKQLMTGMDKHFFREAYQQDRILFDLIESVKTMDSIPEISRLLRVEIEKALHPARTYIFHHRERECDFFLVHSSLPPAAELKLTDSSELTSILRRARGTLLWDDLRDRSGPELDRRLDALGVEVIVPVPGSDNKLLGVIMLGGKRSEEPYTRGDLRLLDSIAAQVGVVYENLALRERVKIEEQVQAHVLARLDDQQVDIMRECPACGLCYDPPSQQCLADGTKLEFRLPIGRLVGGKYRLDRRVGEGGMGAVFEASDTRLDRTVAVKILTGRLFGDSGALRRFAREARASALLDHPNIVRIHDYGEIAGEGAFLVQEFVAGAPLSTVYSSLAGDPRSAAAVMDLILAGMEAAHASHVIHRDLKPGNILVSRRAESDPWAVKIIDFGLAKVRQLEFSDPKSGTEPGMAMGTLGYMSMEQGLGLEVDGRADVYSLGVIALEMMTGKLEKYGYAMHLGAALLEERLGHAGAGAGHHRLKDVLGKCLALEPEARYQSIAEMRRDLVPAMAACAVSARVS